MHKNNEKLEETVSVVLHINMVNWCFFVMLIVLLAVQNVILLYVYQIDPPYGWISLYAKQIYHRAKTGQFPRIALVKKTNHFCYIIIGFSGVC
ncbi:MAG: hypothetical protein PF637_08825 [Spirochaetes bacterium]|jgi:hypothetical protein|nr:hypothetical protein [Spirochaetota bacterium]